MQFRAPAACQLLERAHIQVAVVEVRLQLGHVLDEKAPVLTDGIAAHGRLGLADVFLDEGQQFLFGIGFGGGAGLDLLGQAAAPVGARVPGVHGLEQCIFLVNHHHGARHADGQVRTGDDHGNLEQALLFGIQAGHLAIEPDQVVIVLGQVRRRLGRGCGSINSRQVVGFHPRIVSQAGAISTGRVGNADRKRRHPAHTPPTV